MCTLLPSVLIDSIADSTHREEMKSIFDPVLRVILTLVLQHKNRTMRLKLKCPNAILLVGGLGGNRILYDALALEFHESGAGDTDILQPSGPEV